MSRAHEEVQSLLGAYALHGVDPAEATDIATHLAGCPRCRAEVDVYEAITPMLAAGAGAPPEGLWEEVLGTIEQAPPVGMVRDIRRAARPRTAWSRFGPALAAVAAVVIAVLAVSVAELHSQVGQDRTELASASLQAPIRAALADPRHRVVDLTGNGAVSAKVVELPGGQAYVVSSTLPALAAGRTYQLWAVTAGRTVSVGLLGRAGSPAAFRLEPGTSSLMVTAEPTGGVPQPDSGVVVRSAVPPTL